MSKQGYDPVPLFALCFLVLFLFAAFSSLANVSDNANGQAKLRNEMFYEQTNGICPMNPNI